MPTLSTLCITGKTRLYCEKCIQLGRAIVVSVPLAVSCSVCMRKSNGMDVITLCEFSYNFGIIDHYKFHIVGR